MCRSPRARSRGCCAARPSALPPTSEPPFSNRSGGERLWTRRLEHKLIAHRAPNTLGLPKKIYTLRHSKSPGCVAFRQRPKNRGEEPAAQVQQNRTDSRIRAQPGSTGAPLCVATLSRVKQQALGWRAGSGWQLPRKLLAKLMLTIKSRVRAAAAPGHLPAPPVSDMVRIVNARHPSAES